MGKCLYAVLIIPALCSCGGAEHVDSGDATMASLQLAGIWTSCESFNRTSTQSVHEYTGNEFVYSREDFLNIDCSGVPLDTEEVSEGTYTVGEPVINADGSVAYKLDLHIESLYGGGASSNTQAQKTKALFTNYTIFSVTDGVLYYAETQSNSEEFRPNELSSISSYSQN